MKLDCLIVNPSALSQIYQSLSTDLAAIEPPIWAGLLANGVRARGWPVHILDCEAHNLNVSESALRIKEFDARLVVIVVYGQQPSASTQNMHAASLLCKEVKAIAPETKILLVGGHVSALPERTLSEENCDYVAKGEGLHTILDLLGGISPGPEKRIAQEDLSALLPGVAWDLLPMSKYRAHNWHAFSNDNDRSHYASLYTSLGCPYRCTFCCINAPFGGSSFRYWEPEFTLKQFDILANTYGVKNVKIADEMFVLKPDHYLKIAEGLIGRRHDFNIWAYARIDTVKPDTLKVLKKAGINWLALGIESGSRFVRDGVKKGRFDGHDIKLIVEQIQDAGINVIGNYIFGLPDDDFKTMNETLDLAIDLNCEMSNFYSAMAYPGSQLYTMALDKGWELPKSWLGYSQHSEDCLPLRTEHISGGHVLGFRDYAFNQYFGGYKYRSMVIEKFGNETLARIDDMRRHSLKRNLAIPYL